MSTWSLNPIFGSYPLVFGLAGLLLLLLWVKPRFPTATPERRRRLNLLRLLVIALVTLAMLRPTLISKETKAQSATIAILLDVSRSMTLPAATGEQTRWEAARHSLAQMQPVIDELRETYEVDIHLFDSQARKLTVDGEGLPDQPVGEESDIATSLDEVVRGLTGKRIAGVFLLSDGVQRAVSPRVDLQQPARELARRECPLWATAFGQARDQSQARDVAIENLPDQYTVFSNNELEIKAALRVQGYAGKAVPVELRVTAPDGSVERIGPVSLLANEQDQLLQVQMAYTPTLPGAYRLTLRAAPQAGEQVTENNELTAFATVLEGGLRVLFVDGNVGWQERKFIRRSLDASPDIDVDVMLDTRTDRESAITLPWENTSADYDVFLIGDISSSALGNDNAVKIANAVADGKGLMTIGGVNAFGPGGYARSPLAEVLPIGMDRLERQAADEPIREDVHHTVDLQMMPLGDHFILRLAGGDTAAKWAALPPLFGANRFKKLGDQARVLAAANPGAANEIPLLIAGRYGNGRVLTFAGDSTYRWYRYGHADDHRRFWRQTMLWLAQKESDGDKKVTLRLAQRRYRPASRVPVTVVAMDELGDSIVDAEFEVRLAGPGGYSNRVRVSREADDQFTGLSDELTAAGEYEYSVVATRNGEELGKATGGFQILDQDLELIDAAANPGQLASMAAATAEFGGRLLAPEELPLVLEQLADQEVAAEVAYESKWQLADTSSDAGGLFILMITLLVGEWFLRKRWGLV